MELSGVVVGVVGGLTIQLLAMCIAERRERFKRRIVVREQQLERICVTSLILYREEELLIDRLAKAEGGNAQTIKRAVRRDVQGRATTASMMPPSRIRASYVGLTGVQPPPYLNEERPSEGIEVPGEWDL